VARYSSYGSLDDKVGEDGDQFFVGFNNRLRPDQLEPGMLAKSENGRMATNGEWQVRPGIDQFSSPVVVGDQALTTPFTLPTAGQIGDGVTAILDDDAVQLLYGSCPFSDPNNAAEDTNQFIILAANSKAFAYSTNGGSSREIGYPASLFLNESVNLLQTFNKVFIFRNDKVTLENRIRWFDISSAVLSSNVMTITTATDHDFIVNDKININGLIKPPVVGAVDANDVGYTVTGITSNTLTFALTGSDGNYAQSPDGAYVGSDFTKVASGSYSQPVPIDCTNVGVVSGVCTCTADAAEVAQLSVGDTITVSVPDTTTFSEGDKFQIQSIPTTTTFTFLCSVADKANKAMLVNLPVSESGGYIHMPAAEFGHYHQRRLVLPYRYKPAASANTYTYRNIKDEIIFSYILDSDTYDPIKHQMRLNAGRADRVMGFHSFTEDNLVVFNRNSIHLVEGVEEIATSKRTLLTDEIGTVARKSIQQVGNEIIFLSDNGVYGVGFIEGYQLRGIELPLSQSIQGTIDRINKSFVDKACSAYFNNRYYLAVPLDNSQVNNAIIVYNFLNKQWESLDTVNDDSFQINDMFVAGEKSARGVYTTNDLGAINRLDAREDGYDRIVTQVGGSPVSIQVPGQVQTRQYTLGTLDRKKWKSFEMHVESSDTRTSDFKIRAELENLDRNFQVSDLATLNGGSALATGEDISIRGRLGNPRAYGVQYELYDISGRPKLRALKTDGIESFRTIEKAE
jgi:hypothetical protein